MVVDKDNNEAKRPTYVDPEGRAMYDMAGYMAKTDINDKVWRDIIKASDNPKEIKARTEKIQDDLEILESGKSAKGKPLSLEEKKELYKDIQTSMMVVAAPVTNRFKFLNDTTQFLPRMQIISKAVDSNQPFRCGEANAAAQTMVGGKTINPAKTRWIVDEMVYQADKLPVKLFDKVYDQMSKDLRSSTPREAADLLFSTQFVENGSFKAYKDLPINVRIHGANIYSLDQIAREIEIKRGGLPVSLDSKENFGNKAEADKLLEQARFKLQFEGEGKPLKNIYGLTKPVEEKREWLLEKLYGH